MVRDSISLSSPSYIEFSLKDIFSAENYSEFHNLYLFLHASRTKILNERNAWDEWIKAGIDEGQPAREELSKSIKTALQILGEGFLSNPLNSKLREDLQEKKLSKEDFLKELLRLMYRFLFIFCVEERELINPNSNSSQDREAKVRYWKGYSFHRFKDKALKSYFQNEFSDAWDSVRVVFKGLEKGEKFIGLPALGGLFDSSQCKNLVESTLDNRHFYRAMKLMRWATLNGVFSSVDYKNMGTEELGSIYESLLELVPIIKIESQEFYFAQEDKGDNARKDTGSYYTPDVLVRHLIKTALVPVIEGKLFNNPSNPEEALLDLKVIDPSCGSGHFLLGASRTIAHYLAKVRAKGEVVTPDLYRVALRDVISHCIYGVDVNELSIELARMALWLEGFNGDLPLSFLDHHLKVGNSLVGILDSSILKQGIPNSRYRSTLGDEQAISFLAKENKSGHNTLKKLLSDKESSLLPTFEVLIPEIESFEALTSKNIFEEREKKNKYHEIKSKIESSRLKKLCDMWMCGFLSMKRDEVQNKIPTTKDLVAFLMDLPSEGRDLNSIVEFSTEFCRKNQIFHWPLEFLSVFENNKGFDCVLGNPPWDVPVLKEVAWFANKVPTIATAKTSAERKKMIRALEDGKFSVSYAGVEENSPTLVDEEKRLFREFKDELEKVKNENAFLKLKEGRYKLTSGNYYAYFAELCTSIVKEGGGVGLITPQDLVTTESTKRFAEWAFNGKLRSFYHFENREKFFPIDGRYNFALFTFLPSTKTESVLYARKIEDLDDPNRNVDLVPADLKEINPNTQTAFLPRSKKDLELLKKIYTASPIFIRDPEDGDPGSNAWKASLSSPFHMSQDSGLFSEEQLPGYVPLYEGKMIHQYDARWASFERNKEGKLEPKEVPSSAKTPDFHPLPRFYVHEDQVQKRYHINKDPSEERWWGEDWILAFRIISRSTDKRTFICSVLPSAFGQGNSLCAIAPHVSSELAACLLANFNSLLLDYIARIKVSGANINMFFVKQFPILPPSRYSQKDKEFIVPRVAKLTRNDEETNKVWLTQYPSCTFQEPEERLKISCELDAYFALLYGLDRKDLEFILDPTEVFGENYPSITFPSLKDEETGKYGEYLTRRYILEAFDTLTKGPLGKSHAY